MYRPTYPNFLAIDVISGSSIADYFKCPLRWCYKWVSDRAPREVGAALTVGVIVHMVFEAYFKGETERMGDYLQALIDEMPEKKKKERATLKELVEPLNEWVDGMPIQETLEVEEPFEVLIEGTPGVMFQGRPDRVVRVFDKVFHYQHKTVGSGRDVGSYISLARRSIHELVYGHVLEKKYQDVGEYGGTIYNLVRKLQYRSRAKGKEGKILHPASAFFTQTFVGVDREEQKKILAELPVIANMMNETAAIYQDGGIVVPNREADAGYAGYGIDPYTPVIMGEASLDDDRLFQSREDLYAVTANTERHKS